MNEFGSATDLVTERCTAPARRRNTVRSRSLESAGEPWAEGRISGSMRDLAGPQATGLGMPERGRRLYRYL